MQFTSPARGPMPDHEQKQAALSYLSEAWAEARHDGVDGDCLAQASLFTALAELVGTYGEEAVSKFVEGLPSRVRYGEFSIDMRRQWFISSLRAKRSNQGASTLGSGCVVAKPVIGPRFARTRWLLAVTQYQAFSVSRNRTGSPVDGVNSSPCHMTRRPRT